MDGAYKKQVPRPAIDSFIELLRSLGLSHFMRGTDNDKYDIYNCAKRRWGGRVTYITISHRTERALNTLKFDWWVFQKER